MVHAGGGTPPVRFPVYETSYLINIHAQKLVDLLESSAAGSALTTNLLNTTNP